MALYRTFSNLQSSGLSVVWLAISFTVLFALNYSVHSVYRYKGEHDATMTILDIGLLTGFTIDKKDLDLVRAFTHTYSSKVNIYY